MSPQTVKFLITAALVLHGLAHGRAFLALIGDVGRSHGAPPVPMRTWLRPSLTLRSAASIALPFWFLSTLGFLLSALSFWGTIAVGPSWRDLAVAASVISTLGIVLFSGTWPGAPSRGLSTLDTAIALVMNAVILVLLLWVGWPPVELIGA